MVLMVQMGYLAVPFVYMSTLVDTDCLLAFSSEVGFEPDADGFVKKLVVAALLPIVVLLWLKLTTGCLFLATRDGASPQEATNYQTSVLIMAVWLMGPNALNWAFATFACGDFDNSGLQRVIHD